MLSKIIYASRAVRPMHEADLQLILKTANRRNADWGVSGLLLYGGQSFLQWLEGEEAVVTDIYTRIERDTRHEQLRLLAHNPIRERRYEDLAMGFETVSNSALTQAFSRYNSSVSFPLASAGLIRNAAAAEDVFRLYGRLVA